MPKLILLALILFVIVAAASPKTMRTIGQAIRLAFLNAGAAKRTITQADLELCYRILGVSSTASWDEIQQAYRRKAKVHHPDKGGDEDAMRTLNEAFSILKRTRASR